MGDVPEAYRAAIRAELDALTAGARPDLLHWVRAYPATLVRQPEEIWTHSESEVVRRDDGTAWSVLPLWTTDASPSDLSAEIEINAEGRVTIHDAHVL
ncbi:hypothetical protein ACIBG5_43550 [Kribbella sp. NPDC050241]|uniref:DUF7668 domain-containing protein n=1 Tax=Kribbella sp. NPDC050241 TaxID=3364115 RepID=UPI003788248A